MLRTIIHRLSLTCVLAALMAAIPASLSAAPPPGAAKRLVKPLVVQPADAAIKKDLPSSAALPSRFSRVLVHPEPKRWINGRCVLPAPVLALPRR